MWVARIRQQGWPVMVAVVGGGLIGLLLAPDKLVGSLTGCGCGAMIGVAAAVVALLGRLRHETLREGGCWRYVREYLSSTDEPVCEFCGMILTPRHEELEALVEYGSPLRRPPCLASEDGQHDLSLATWQESNPGWQGRGI